MVPHTDGDSAVAFGCIEVEPGELAVTLLVGGGRSGIVAVAGRMRWMAALEGVAERIGHCVEHCVGDCVGDCVGQGGQQCRQERWAEHCNGGQTVWVRLLLQVREGRHSPRMDRCESRRR